MLRKENHKSSVMGYLRRKYKVSEPTIPRAIVELRACSTRISSNSFRAWSMITSSILAKQGEGSEWMFGLDVKYAYSWQSTYPLRSILGSVGGE